MMTNFSHSFWFKLIEISEELLTKILKNKYDENSDSYFVTLKIYNKKDSCLNYLSLSKHEIKSQIFYNVDTLINWRNTTHSKLGY